VASSLGFPALGFGLGLRPPHHHEALTAAPPVDWWEVISENFMVAGGTPRRVLRALRASRSVVLHGVSLSIGSAEPLDRGYLERLAALVDEIEPGLVSDHLCWSSLGGHASHDLWPLPYTEEALALVVDKVRRVQDRLGRRILLENPSSYVSKPWVSVRFMIDPWQRGAAGRDRARRAGTTRARR